MTWSEARWRSRGPCWKRWSKEGLWSQTNLGSNLAYASTSLPGLQEQMGGGRGSARTMTVHSREPLNARCLPLACCLLRNYIPDSLQRAVFLRQPLCPARAGGRERHHRAVGESPWAAYYGAPGGTTGRLASEWCPGAVPAWFPLGGVNLPCSPRLPWGLSFSMSILWLHGPQGFLLTLKFSLFVYVNITIRRNSSLNLWFYIQLHCFLMSDVC